MKIIGTLTTLLTSLILISGCAWTGLKEGPSGEVDRKFHVRYVTSMKDCPVGESYRLWIPVPHNDLHQLVEGMKVSGPTEGSLQTESRFGNTMYFFEGVCTSKQMDFTIEYDITRHVYDVNLDSMTDVSIEETPDASMAKYLAASSLCYVSPQVKAEAEELAKGKSSVIEITRAYYDHILDKMAYDKNHQGWGRGDISHACDVGKGNCTDFHTYFNALCLASGIPSRFQIGMWGRYQAEVGEYQTGGYHCWTEFHVPGHGWVPVDISEADKDTPLNKDLYFGQQSGNRVTLSSGRDIVLMPQQSGTPLNFFVNPYAEIGGKTFQNVNKRCFWTDLNGSE